MKTTLSAPKQVTWFVCLVLYVIPVLTWLGVVTIRGNLAVWCWIIGYGVLLAASRTRGL